MTEFDKAKERYEKRKAKVVNIKQEEPVLTRPDSVTVSVVDGGKEYTFRFHIQSIKATRYGAQRSADGYRETTENFVKKEFGRWRSLQIL